MSAPTLRLYNYWRSSSSWRVRIALALKGVEWSYEAVHLLRDGGEQHAGPYREKNPMRQVPTLEIEEAGETRRLAQSLAICLWLDARFPTPPLVPSDPWLAAKAWQLAELVNAGIQPLQNLSVLSRIKAAGLDAKAWAAEHNTAGLAAVEAEAAQTAGRFLVGDEPCIADVCLIPQLYAARRFEVDVAAYPTLSRVEDTCNQHPAFRSTHPDLQPDAQTT